jgi:hypothetical protein
MDQIFQVGDRFRGRASDILNLRGIIGEVKTAGRRTQVLCRFDPEGEEWRLPKDLWKDADNDENDHQEESYGSSSSDKSSEDASEDSDASVSSESTSGNEELDEEVDGKVI